MKKEKSSGVIVFRRDKDIKYLLLQSRKWQTWGFPKGHVEQSETEEQAALRELEEETGLKDRLLLGFVERYSYIFEFNGMQIEKQVIFFLTEAFQNEVRLSEKEHSAYKWLNYEEAWLTLNHDDARKMLKSANEFLLTKLY